MEAVWPTVAWRVACAAAAARSLPPAAGAAGGQRRTDALFLHVSTQPVPPLVKIVPGSVLPPLAAAPATAAAKNNIWTWQQMSLKQARGGRDGTARGTFGSGRLLGGGRGEMGGLQTMWFMRTLEGGT